MSAIVELRDALLPVACQSTATVKQHVRLKDACDALVAEIDRLTREHERLTAMVNGFRKEGESWRDVANAHALKILDLTRELDQRITVAQALEQACDVLTRWGEYQAAEVLRDEYRKAEQP